MTTQETQTNHTKIEKLFYAYPLGGLQPDDNVRVTHDWLVETKSLKRVIIETVSFVPIELHIWLPYVWL